VRPVPAPARARVVGLVAERDSSGVASRRDPTASRVATTRGARREAGRAPTHGRAPRLAPPFPLERIIGCPVAERWMDARRVCTPTHNPWRRRARDLARTTAARSHRTGFVVAAVAVSTVCFNHRESVSLVRTSVFASRYTSTCSFPLDRCYCTMVTPRFRMSVPLSSQVPATGSRAKFYSMLVRRLILHVHAAMT
jgi:hypothetical protein